MSKLVRDKIPEIIFQNDGVEPKIRIVSDELELISALDTKLDEEIAELRSARDSKSSAEEIADIIEVLLAIGRK